MYKKRQLFRFGFWVGVGFMTSAYVMMWFVDSMEAIASIITTILINGV